jgi:heat shock protein HslJ
LVLILAALALTGCSAGGEALDDGVAGGPAINGMTDVVWQWLRVDSTGSGGEQVTVANPADYTVIFRADGSMSGQADCNNFEGTYTMMDGGAMTIAIAHSTDESCGEDSLDREFLDLLSGVAAGGPDGAGGFAMTTAAGADYMLFGNGGSAP